MVRIRRILAAGIAFLALGTSEALAHGGFYQPPVQRTPDGIPIEGGPGGGFTGPNSGPSSGGPTFGPAVTGRKRGRENGPETKPTGEIPAALAPPAIGGAKWERWWELNKLRFLGLARERIGRTQTGDEGAVAAAPVNVGSLIAGLGDSSQDVRAAAALALGRIGTERAGPALRKRLSVEEHAQVRTSLTLALVMLGESRDLLLFDGLIRDKDQPMLVRYLATLGIGVVGGPDAVAILEPYLAHRPGKPAAAPQALVATGYYALGWTGDDRAVELLRHALAERHHRPVVRSFAELALGRLGDRESMETLSDTMLRDRDVSLRRSAALAIGRLATPKDEKYVARLVLSARVNSDPGTRRMSALALGPLRSDDVRAALVKSFGDAKDLDRPFFALALAFQGELDDGTVLRDALEKDDFEESLQASYAIALGILGDLGAAPRMEEEVLRLERKWSPGYAALGLAMMGSRRSIPAIRERLDKTEDERLRNVLQVSLGLLREPETLTELRRRTADGSSVYDRATAAVAMGLVEDAGGLDLLAKVAADEEAPGIVRAAAIGALGRLGSGARPPHLTTFVEPHNFSVNLATILHLSAALNTR